MAHDRIRDRVGSSLTKPKRQVTIMPTVLRVGGFRIIIWPSDHAPPHVHVHGADGRAVIEIESGAVRRFVGMRRPALVRAVGAVRGNEAILLERWREIHG